MFPFAILAFYRLVSDQPLSVRFWIYSKLSFISDVFRHPFTLFFHSFTRLCSKCFFRLLIGQGPCQLCSFTVFRMAFPSRSPKTKILESTPKNVLCISETSLSLVGEKANSLENARYDLMNASLRGNV